MDAKLVEQYEEQAMKAAVGFVERVSAGQYQSIDDVANLPEMTKLVLDYCTNRCSEQNEKHSLQIEQSQLQVVSHALALAEHDLSFLHGARVTDIPNENTTWQIDNSSTLHEISEALSLLDILDNSHTVCCP